MWSLIIALWIDTTPPEIKYTKLAEVKTYQECRELPFAKDDSFVHTLIDANSYVEKKMSAMKAHATQIAVDGPFFALSNNLGLQVWGNEYYTLVKGEKSPPFNEKGYETDLFAGISL